MYLVYSVVLLLRGNMKRTRECDKLSLTSPPFPLSLRLPPPSLHLALPSQHCTASVVRSSAVRRNVSSINSGLMGVKVVFQEAKEKVLASHTTGGGGGVERDIEGRNWLPLLSSPLLSSPFSPLFFSLDLSQPKD